MELEGLQSSLLSAPPCEPTSGGLSAIHLSTEQRRAVGKMQSLIQGWKGHYKGSSYVYLTVRMNMKSKCFIKKKVSICGVRQAHTQAGGRCSQSPLRGTSPLQATCVFYPLPSETPGLKKASPLASSGYSSSSNSRWCQAATAWALQVSMWGGPAGLYRYLHPSTPCSQHPHGTWASELLHSDQKPSRDFSQVSPFWSGNWKAVVEI